MDATGNPVAPADQPVNPEDFGPNQDLPHELDDDEEDKVPPGQDPDKVRGKSEDARGHNKPEPR